MHQDEADSTDAIEYVYNRRFYYPSANNDASLRVNATDFGFNYLESNLSLYEEDTAAAYDGILEYSALRGMYTRDLFLYSSNLIFMLVNELVSLETIQLPGYKFSYKLSDIIFLNELDFKLNNFSGSLPFYKPSLNEFLHVLIGSRTSTFDDYYNYIFLKNDNLKKSEQFKDFDSYRSFFDSEEIFDDYMIRVRKTDSIISKFSSSQGHLNSEYVREFYAEDSIYTAHSPRREHSSYNYALPTIWFSNKVILNNLDILKFSSIYLLNTNFFTNILRTEITSFDHVFWSNLFLNIQLLDSFSFISSLTFNNLQYRLNERILPFYLRFNRLTPNFLNDIDYVHKPLLKIIDDYLIKFRSNVSANTIFDVTTPEDLLLVQPYNSNGIFSYEALFTALYNVKFYFSRLLIQFSDFYFDELLLDFHNIEFYKYYSYGLIQTYKNQDLFFDDWLDMIEDAKEWVVYLSLENQIELMPTFHSQAHDFYNMDKVTARRFRRHYYRVNTPFKYLRRRYANKRFKLFNSQQLTPIYSRQRRYIEEPLFPDPYFQFKFALNFLPPSNAYNNPSILNKFFFKSESPLSDDFLCHATSLQLIETRVYSDVFLMLTSEGRSINTFLSKQSSLQLYSYFNIHLILSRHHYYFANTVNSRSMHFFIQSFVEDSYYRPIKTRSKFINTRTSKIFAYLKNFLLLCFVLVLLFI